MTTHNFSDCGSHRALLKINSEQNFRKSASTHQQSQGHRILVCLQVWNRLCLHFALYEPTPASTTLLTDEAYLAAMTSPGLSWKAIGAGLLGVPQSTGGSCADSLIRTSTASRDRCDASISSKYTTWVGSSTPHSKSKGLFVGLELNPPATKA